MSLKFFLLQVFSSVCWEGPILPRVVSPWLHPPLPLLLLLCSCGSTEPVAKVLPVVRPCLRFITLSTEVGSLAGYVLSSPFSSLFLLLNLVSVASCGSRDSLWWQQRGLGCVWQHLLYMGRGNQYGFHLDCFGWISSEGREILRGTSVLVADLGLSCCEGLRVVSLSRSSERHFTYGCASSIWLCCPFTVHSPNCAMIISP